MDSVIEAWPEQDKKLESWRPQAKDFPEPPETRTGKETGSPRDFRFRATGLQVVRE